MRTMKTFLLAALVAALLTVSCGGEAPADTGVQIETRAALSPLLILGNGTNILVDQVTGTSWVQTDYWVGWTSVYISRGSGWGNNHSLEPLQVSQWVLTPTGNWYWVTTTAGNASWRALYNSTRIEWRVTDPEGNVWFSACWETPTAQFTAPIKTTTCEVYQNNYSFGGTMNR